MNYTPWIELQMAHQGWHYSLRAIAQHGADIIIRDSARPFSSACEAASAAQATWDAWQPPARQVEEDFNLPDYDPTLRQTF